MRWADDKEIAKESNANDRYQKYLCLKSLILKTVPTTGIDTMNITNKQDITNFKRDQKVKVNITALMENSLSWVKNSNYRKMCLIRPTS